MRLLGLIGAGSVNRALAKARLTAISGPVKRLGFIDVTRGVAVVAMILWHTGDGWLRPGLKAGEGFTFLRFVGGLAAPSFLLLAGLAAALSARDEPERRRSQLLSGLGRGAEIVVIGYALRLQSWLVDATAITKLHTVRAWLPIAFGYGVIYWAAGKLATDPRRATYAAVAGSGLAAVGFLQIESVAPGRALRLMQVDVLIAIGASLMLLAALQGLLKTYQRPLLLVALGASVGLATSFVWASLPGALPIPIAALLGKFDPAPGTPSASLFPLFPWFAYACFGAAIGRAWRASSARGSLETAVLAFGVVGAGVACLTSESQPFLRAFLLTAPSLTPLVRVAYRCALVLVMLTVAYAFGEGRVSRLLASFGTTSLRIYWAHMFFAYGIAARPVRSQIGYVSWAILAAILLTAMWGVSRVRAKPDRT